MRPLFPPRGPSHNHTLGSLPQPWAPRISLNAKASKADTDQVPRPSRTPPPWRRPPGPACVSGTQTCDNESHLAAPPAHESRFSEKLTARNSQFSQGHSSYLGCNPGSCQKPHLSVSSSARGGDRNLCLHPQGSGRKWPQLQAEASPGAIIRMGLSRLRTGDKPQERPAKTHTSPMQLRERPSNGSRN